MTISNQSLTSMVSPTLTTPIADDESFTTFTVTKTCHISAALLHIQLTLHFKRPCASGFGGFLVGIVDDTWIQRRCFLILTGQDPRREQDLSNDRIFYKFRIPSYSLYRSSLSSGSYWSCIRDDTIAHIIGVWVDLSFQFLVSCIED
jgi:hypothetical protein